MATMSNYFVDSKKLVADNSSIIKGQKYRFTILSDILVRMEYSPNGVFEDRATEQVVCRKFDTINYNVVETENLIQIKTIYFTLTYDKEKPFTGMNLKVLLNESNKEWTYQNKEVRNFGSINYSLDNYQGSSLLGKGLYSSDGFSAIDDSNSLVLSDNDEFILRENKEVDVYLFVYRRDFNKCLEDYYKLTGYPSFIPRYALGNWWYKNENYNMQDIGEVVKKFYENNIPISIFMLGNNWHDNINNFSFNPQSFPDLQVLNNFLKSNKIKFGLTISTQLGITSQDNLYEQARQALNNNSSRINIMPLNLSSTTFYFNNYISTLTRQGVDFFGIDYNNSKDLVNLWLLNHYHYTYLPTKTSKRGLILSRNSMIAPHRYPVIYSGFTKVNWETLNVLPYYNSSAANLGVSFVAHPIGGYYNGIEDAELYMRYVQFGVFSPILILASDKGKYYKREPWRWSKLTLDIIADYLRLRHRLIPYIYSESYIYYKTGAPLVQPLYYAYPKIYDEPLYKNEYYFGTRFLIAPITKRKNPIMNRVVQRIFIPEGTWYDFQSGKKYPGNRNYMSFYKDEDYPAFVKEGSIIPMSLDYTTDAPADMELQIFPGKSDVYNLYEDDGTSEGYKKGDYLITNFEYEYNKDNVTLKIKRLEGRSSSVTQNRNYKIVFRNMRSAIVSVTVSSKPKEVVSYPDRNDFVIEIKDVSVLDSIEVNCKGNNIEIEAINLINDDIAKILDDLEIETVLKERIDNILFSDLPIRNKRIEIRKLKKYKLEPKFIKMFINLLEYINQV